MDIRAGIRKILEQEEVSSFDLVDFLQLDIAFNNGPSKLVRERKI